MPLGTAPNRRPPSGEALPTSVAVEVPLAAWVPSADRQDFCADRRTTKPRNRGLSREEPRVRIQFPPAVSPQTIGSATISRRLSLSVRGAVERREGQEAMARYCLTASAPAWATWPSCGAVPPLAPAILPPAMISTPGRRASRRRQREALPAWCKCYRGAASSCTVKSAHNPTSVRCNTVAQEGSGGVDPDTGTSSPNDDEQGRSCRFAFESSRDDGSRLAQDLKAK